MRLQTATNAAGFFIPRVVVWRRLADGSGNYTLDVCAAIAGAHEEIHALRFDGSLPGVGLLGGLRIGKRGPAPDT